MKQPSQRRRCAPGFTLVEVMVGVTIGLVGMLIMFRMVSVWDTHTRSSAAGNDAQTSGTLAMFALERDLKNAGMGIGVAPPGVMGCMVTAKGMTSFPLRPVSIAPGVNGSDELTVFYGTSSFMTDLAKFTDSTATTKKLVRRDGFKQGDIAVVSTGAAGSPCELIEVTDTSTADMWLKHTQVTYTSYYAAAPAPSRFNPAAGTVNAFPSGTIFSLGPMPSLNVWAIRNTGSTPTLVTQDLIRGTPETALADGVVGLKAQYGVDADGDGKISEGATPEWTTVAPADWTRLLAIRVSLLVRSKQFERSADPAASAATYAVTRNPPTWRDCTVANCRETAFTMTNVNGSADSYDETMSDPNNWRYYRYRVYQKVIPLRNMIWGTTP